MTTTVLWTATERCAECGHSERLIIGSADGTISRCYVCGDVEVKKIGTAAGFLSLREPVARQDARQRQ